jgi:2,5-diamino-6-(ribosylamino)-4(3H)-pyrimidinone 5'-phosphate reductase
MGPSVDGRIVTRDWPSAKQLTREYERTARTFEADAWIAGRISMQPYAGKAKIPRATTKGRALRKDFIANASAKSYAITIDPSGKIPWKSNNIDGEHVITVLSGRVSDNYLAFLQDRGVSYLLGGRTEIDLKSVLRRLTKYFRIRTLLLEGGGGINGSFLAAGVIDELSLLVAPTADGSVGTPTLFDVKERKAPVALRLLSARKLTGDILWVRYRIRR